jgi:pectate lyase
MVLGVLASCGSHPGAAGGAPMLTGAGGGGGAPVVDATPPATVIDAARPTTEDARAEVRGAAADAAPAKDGSPAKDSGAAPDRAPSDGAARADGAAADALTIAEPACKWPTATADQKLSATMSVAKLFDGGMKRYAGTGALGTSGQSESQMPLFELASGATLENVIIGSPAADGVHCAGPCTLVNVWWEDVGEDAATFRGSSASQVMTVDGGGARHAADKVFQHNGAGTLVIQSFCVEDFGKLYRSCGNCTTQYPRHAVLRNISATLPGKTLVGLNENYGDTATLSDIFVHGGKLDICQRYTGNDTGAEPPETAAGPDPVHCLYTSADVIAR